MNAKEKAAATAVEIIRDGMTVGLGSGTTSAYAIEAIGKRVAAGLAIRAVATSLKSEALARRCEIPVAEPGETDGIDVAFDGADEVDKKGNLMKGGGGSLLREKIIAFASQKFYAMVDDTKLVDTLGNHPLAVEIVPFGAALTLQHIRTLKGNPVLRRAGGKPFTTDNGNLIADCSFGAIDDPAWLDVKLKMIPGVVETGLFLNRVVTGIFIGFEHAETRFVSLEA